MAVFVFLTAFAAYAWTASPAMGWLDSPEFVAASASLGIPHSPGHPLTVLLGALGTLVPVGDITTRVNLMSAAAGALACAVLHAAARRVLDAAAPGLSGRSRSVMAGGVALLLGLSGAAWGQAVRAETYALELLLFAGLIYFALRYAAGERRALLAGALVAGLALATHHLITLTFLLPAAIFLWPKPEDGSAARGARAWPRAGMAVLVGLLGLAVFAYLPVRSAGYPAVNWGSPHTADRLAWTVSARAFHKSTGAEHVSTPIEDAVQVVASLAEQGTWVLFIAAILGIYVGLRQRRTRRITLYLVATLALGAGARVLVGFDPDTPDHQGYLAPALAALVMLGAAGLASLASTAREQLADRALARWLGPGLAAGLMILAGYQGVRFHGAMASGDASEAMAAWELDRLPPRTVLLTSYFQTRFRLMAKETVDRARPDVAIIDRSFLTYPGAADEARQRYPDLAALIDAPVAAGSPMPLDVLAELARQRPIAVQLHLNLDPRAEPWLVPAGPFARFGRALPDQAERGRAEALDAAERRALVKSMGALPHGEQNAVIDALLWHDFTRLGFFCRLGRRSAASAALGDAWALAPGDLTLREIAQQCGLAVPR